MRASALFLAVVGLFVLDCARTVTPARRIVGPHCVVADLTPRTPGIASDGGYCDETGWCWDTSHPTGDPVSALWVSPLQRVWVTYAGEQGAREVAQWDGSAWHVMVPRADVRWGAVDGVDDNDVWLRGRSADGVVIAHGHDGAWTLLPTLAVPRIDPQPDSLWVFSATDAWVVTDRLMHWDGSQWHEAPALLDDTTSARFVRVGHEVVGSYFRGVFRFDGDAWQMIADLPFEPWTTVPLAGSSSRDLWLFDRGFATAHWDGTRWTTTPAIEDQARACTAVLANASDDVWCMDMDSQTGAAWLRHWQGSAWEALDVPRPVGHMARRERGPLWVAGRLGFVAERSSADRDATWSVRAGVDDSVYAAVTNTGDDVWLATYEGSWPPSHSSIVHRAHGREIRRDGFDTQMRVLSANALDDVWAAGDGGVVAHWNGARWITERIPVEYTPVDLWSRGDDVWLANGSLLHRVRGVWQRVVITDPSSDQEMGVWSVHGTDVDDVWITAVRGAGWSINDVSVGHWDGTEWRLERVGTESHGHLGLPQVTVRTYAPHDVWIAGVRDDASIGNPRVTGSLLHGDLGHWDRVPLVAGYGVESIAGTSACDVWFLSETDTLHWDGNALEHVAYPGAYELRTLSASDDGTVVGISGGGGVLTRGRAR